MTEQQAFGYLTVRVSTASGAIPLEGATVNIRGSVPENSAVIRSLTTNSDGLTPTVTLAAPPRSASQSPDNTAPAYAVYNIDVFADGYIPAYFHNVPVFAGINSVQPAVLIIDTGRVGYEPSDNVTVTPIM